MAEKTEKNPKGAGRKKLNKQTTHLSLRISAETKKILINKGFKFNKEINEFLNKLADEENN